MVQSLRILIALLLSTALAWGQVESVTVGSGTRNVINSGVINFATNQLKVNSVIMPPAIVGSDKQIIFNSGGTAYAGDSDFTWDQTNNILAIATGAGSYIRVVTNSGVDGFLLSPFGTTSLDQNTFYNGGWKYDKTGPAAQIQLSGTSIDMALAPSGSAGGTITFTNMVHIVQGGGIAFGNTADPGSGYVNVPTGYKINGTSILPVTITNIATGTNKYLHRTDSGVSGWKPALLVNASTSTQTITTTDTYLTGSKIVIAAGDWVVGTVYHCTINVSKGAVGTGAPAPILRVGTAGTTSDVAVYTPTYIAGTAATDNGNFEFWLTVTGTGASATSLVQTSIIHSVNAGGITNAPFTQIGNVVAGAAFNSTTATTIGVSYQGGTGASHTVAVLRAELMTP